MDMKKQSFKDKKEIKIKNILYLISMWVVYALPLGLLLGWFIGYHVGVRAEKDRTTTEVSRSLLVIETSFQELPLTPTQTPTPTISPTPTPTPIPIIVDEDEVAAMARMLYGEANCVTSDEEVAKCAWVALNRVDSPSYPDDLLTVLAQSGQFHGYKVTYPVTERMYNIAKDVLTRYAQEKAGLEITRELENDYLYFHGDGVNNYFKKAI